MLTENNQASREQFKNWGHSNPLWIVGGAGQYKNCSDGIGVLQNGSEYVNDDSIKSELLQSQFCSVWSTPSVCHEIQDMECIFGQCLNCIHKVTHICKYDVICEVIEEYRDQILNIPNENPSIKMTKNPVFEGYFHTEIDFEKAIDKLLINAACGPDGISTNLIKRLKYPMAKFLAKLYLKTWKNGNFPSVLKRPLS